MGQKFLDWLLSIWKKIKRLLSFICFLVVLCSLGIAEWQVLKFIHPVLIDSLNSIVAHVLSIGLAIVFVLVVGRALYLVMFKGEDIELKQESFALTDAPFEKENLSDTLLHAVHGEDAERANDVNKISKKEMLIRRSIGLVECVFLFGLLVLAEMALISWIFPGGIESISMNAGYIRLSLIILPAIAIMYTSLVVFYANEDINKIGARKISSKDLPTEWQEKLGLNNDTEEDKDEQGGGNE